MVDADSEDQRCTGGQLAISLCDRVGCAFHCFVQLTGRVVTPLRADLAQIVTNIDAPAKDIAEISVLDAPAKISLKDDLGEHRIQADLVSAIRGSGETDQFLRPEVIEDLPVSIRCGMVRLIADDQAKFIRSETVQAAHKRLH